MSLNEDMIETKSSSPDTGARNLRQRRKSHHAYLCHRCLGTFGDMYFNPCCYNFCISCARFLLETKAECPACKQSFHSVLDPAKEAKTSSAECFPLLSKKHEKEETPSLGENNLMEVDEQITVHHPGNYHWHAMRKETSEQKCTGRMQNKTTFKSMPVRMKIGDYDPEDLCYRATLTCLPWTDMTEATLMLIAFGALLFICLYVYLSLAFLPE